MMRYKFLRCHVLKALTLKALGFFALIWEGLEGSLWGFPAEGQPGGQTMHTFLDAFKINFIILEKNKMKCGLVTPFFIDGLYF